MFEAIRAARQLDQTLGKIETTISEDAFRLVLEIGRAQPISYQDTADAVWDCFCAGHDLEQTRATIMESLRTSVPVRSLIELYVRAQTWSHDN